MSATPAQLSALARGRAAQAARREAEQKGAQRVTRAIEGGVMGGENTEDDLDQVPTGRGFGDASVEPPSATRRARSRSTAPTGDVVGTKDGAHRFDVVRDLDEEYDPEFEDAEENWDGVPTTLRLAFPIMRGEGQKFAIVGDGDPCMGWYDEKTNRTHPGCRDAAGKYDRSHQIHVKANYIKLPPGTTNRNGTMITGRWVGPEGQHVEDLFTGGYIKGTPQAGQKAREIAAVDEIRGTFGTKERPEGWPELVALDAPALRQLLRRARQPMDAAEALRVERQSVGQEVTVLKAALKLMGIDPEAFAGAIQRTVSHAVAGNSGGGAG